MNRAEGRSVRRAAVARETEGGRRFRESAIYPTYILRLARNSNCEIAQNSQIAHYRTCFRMCRFDFRSASSLNERASGSAQRARAIALILTYFAIHIGNKNALRDFSVRNRTRRIIRVEIYVRDAPRANYLANNSVSRLALFSRSRERAKLASLISIRLLSRR